MCLKVLFYYDSNSSMSLINKPLVVEKFKSFHNYVKNNDGKIGIKQRGIDLSK